MKDGRVVGIDVAKRSLDVAVSGRAETRTFANDRTGVRRLVRELLKESVTRIVVEATGGYEREVVDALSAGGPSGRDRVDHPRGGHDDRANAVAGVASLVVGKQKRPAFMFQ